MSDTPGSKRSVLIVDDEPICRTMLKSFIDEDKFTVLEASDGASALDLVTENLTSISLIITDWYMPEMDGLTFIQKLSQAARCHIPIIMQTNNKDADALMQAHNAGANVFLSKPIDPNLLASIIESMLLERPGNETPMDHQYESENYSSFTLKTLEQALVLESHLSKYYPNKERAKIGIHELLINAIEHGNLGISYEEKGQLLKECRWLEEIRDRLQRPPYKDKVVVVEFIKSDNDIQLIIEDQGPGFEPEDFFEMTAERMLDLHGRGIAMSRKLSFDQVNYIGKGNKVIARTFL